MPIPIPSIKHPQVISSKSNLFLFGSFSFKLQVTLLTRICHLNTTKNKTLTLNLKQKTQETLKLILLLKVSL